MMNETEERGIQRERMDLALKRLDEIPRERLVQAPFRVFFERTAEFLQAVHGAAMAKASGMLRKMTAEALEGVQRQLYRDIMPEWYGESYLNPDYAVNMLGAHHGPLLCFLAAQLRGAVSAAFRGYEEELLIYTELFLQVYHCYVEEAPPAEEIRDILYWFISDYSDDFAMRQTMEQLDPAQTYFKDIISGWDLTDTRYLYQFGAYVSPGDVELAEYLASLPEEQIRQMAHTFTEGYRTGFQVTGKDISIKKTVNIRYPLGFERVIKEAMGMFAAMGLETVIYGQSEGAMGNPMGVGGSRPNPQYTYDHKDDMALFLDKRYVERRLGARRAAFEAYKELAAVHGGPAVMETFGETPFHPQVKDTAWKLSKKQQKLAVELQSRLGDMTNEYIPGEERSFTIIAFPVPDIGSRFPEIFQETIRINTLDYTLYRNIQQTIIDTLDQGVAVHIEGAGDNRTDLTVMLHPLEHPDKETIFENCVADVNIPVGEVFTSPVLEGTNGVLHVSRVYLNELLYEDLEITFQNGMTTGYTCSNFPDAKTGADYIRENVFHYHERLPMGEFAIGTNTAAYVMAGKFHIEDKLPILIAEKMGPHFAVGDTCYSHDEDRKVYNPDGKEIVARDNSCSALRKTDPAKAYFNTHVDITIPYDELEHIQVIRADGTRVSVIEKGRFVLVGTEELNAPFLRRQSGYGSSGES